MTDGEVMGRRERRKQEVHDRIVAAAVNLFGRRGLDATTVDQITDAADVAQKTFFNHFATKQDLIRELAEWRVDRMHEVLEEQRKIPGTTGEKLERIFVRYADEVEELGRLARELVVEIIRLSPPDGSGIESPRDMHGTFGPLLQDGREAGDVRTDLDLEFLTEMTVGAFSAVMLNWVSMRDYPLRDRFRTTAAFLAEALAARPDARLRRRT